MESGASFQKPARVLLRGRPGVCVCALESALSLRFGDLDPARIFPQSLQIVKEPCPLQKNVDDKAEIVQQNPFRLRIAFHMSWRQPRIFKSLDDAITNGLRVAGRSAGANQKEIRKRETPLQFHHPQSHALPSPGSADATPSPGLMTALPDELLIDTLFPS